MSGFPHLNADEILAVVQKLSPDDQLALACDLYRHAPAIANTTWMQKWVNANAGRITKLTDLYDTARKEAQAQAQAESDKTAFTRWQNKRKAQAALKQQVYTLLGDIASGTVLSSSLAAGYAKRWKELDL